MDLKVSKGFTLIELLVVVAIIGLLMSITLPVIRKAKQLATRAACKANLHACAIAMQMYLDDSNNFMPPADPFPSLFGEAGLSIRLFLKPYLSDLKSLQCPGDVLPVWHELEKVQCTYYELEGISYEYTRFLRGKHVDRKILRTGYKDYQIHVLGDYDPFHGKRGHRGAFNYLYADGHVGDREDRERIDDNQN